MSLVLKKQKKMNYSCYEYTTVVIIKSIILLQM